MITIIITNERGFYLGTYKVDWKKLMRYLEG